MKTAQVTAVHEDDALAFLALLGVAGDYEQGTLSCVVCGTPLRDGGLGAARRNEVGAFEFACERLDCLEEFQARAAAETVDSPLDRNPR